MSIIRPDILLDFANARGLDPRIVFTRASSGLYMGNAGSYLSAPANAPRLSSDRSTGQYLGLDSEPQATNEIANPRGDGATTGTLGGAGAWPTGWGVAAGIPAGMAVDVLAATTVMGLPIRPIRYYGTLSQNFSQVFTAAPATLSGSTYTCSVMPVLLGGSLTNISSTSLTVSGEAGSLTYSLSSTPQLVSVTRTFSAAGRRHNAVIAPVFGQPFDLTVGWLAAQIELGTYASAPILNPAGTPGVTTRAAEAASLTLANFGLNSFGAEGGLVVSARAAPGINTDQTIAELHDGTANEAIRLYRRASDNAVVLSIIDGGVEQGPLVAATLAHGADAVIAFGWAGNSAAISVNGGAPITDTALTTPLLTTLHIAQSRAGSQGWGGSVRRLALHGRRPTNTQLQLLSA